MNDHLLVLQERYKWLAARIEAKKQVGWETQWDEREHAALGWAVQQLTPPPPRYCVTCEDWAYRACPFVMCPMREKPKT